MTLEEVSSEQYKEIIREPFHVFASASFNALNATKVESIHYLVFKDSKYRMGLIAGCVQQTILSPFSAPFGGFTPIYEDVKISTIEEAVDLTIAWAKEKGMNELKLTLPPPIYFESYLAKMSNVLFRKNFCVANQELNFHFDLAKLTPEYTQAIWRNARKNLTIALASNLSFSHCITLQEKETAYEVIKRNRLVRGKPLRMQWEQVLATTQTVPADFFLVATKEGRATAAAIVFNVAPQIAQVIYWGDIPDFQQLKTMNFLSFKVFEYYKEKDFRIVDIGYSTEDSVPNYGLCEFKESLGCSIQPKHTFVKDI
jgi:hypothetical protein